jgi:hypothetical protein
MTFFLIITIIRTEAVDRADPVIESAAYAALSMMRQGRPGQVERIILRN